MEDSRVMKPFGIAANIVSFRGTHLEEEQRRGRESGGRGRGERRNGSGGREMRMEKEGESGGELEAARERGRKRDSERGSGGVSSVTA